MPAKTSTTPTTSAPSYMRLLRGTLTRRPAARPYETEGYQDTENGRQMAGSCGNGQMVAGRAEDPALVHF